MNLTEAYLNVLEEEKKKKDIPFAKDTDKEDDGEGMDSVGKEDSDVDNDGDSDESDVYLKKRRNTVKKAIDKDGSENVEEAAKPKVDKATKDKVNKAFSKTAGMDDKSLEIVAKKTGLTVDQVKAALSESVEVGLMERAPARKGDKLGNKEDPRKDEGLEKSKYSKLGNQGHEQGRWEENPTTAAKMKAKACYENVEVLDVRGDKFDAFIDGEFVADIDMSELDEAYEQLDEISDRKKQDYIDAAQKDVKKANRFANKARAHGNYAHAKAATDHKNKRLDGISKASRSMGEEVEHVEEDLEKDGPKKSTKFRMAKGDKAKAYAADKVQQRKDMNAKNDPGAAKKGLALSVTDKQKAAGKAIKKGVKFSPYDMAQGKKPNKMQLIQKGLDPKMAREDVEEKSFAQLVAEAWNKKKQDPNTGDRDILGPDAKGEQDFVDAHKTDTVVDGAKDEGEKPEVKVKSQSKPNPGDKRASEPMKKVKESWLESIGKLLNR